MRLATINRFIGPILISLGKMVRRSLSLLVVFLLVHFAFAFSINDLFKYYDTEDGQRVTCECVKNESYYSSGDEGIHSSCGEKEDCETPEFSSLLFSLTGLYWSLFGLFEQDNMTFKEDRHKSVQYAGKILFSVYIFCAVLILLNVLIAIVNKAYDFIKQNEDIAWKYHRATVWIRFAETDAMLPPPMNLPLDVWHLVKLSMRKFKDCKCKCGKKEENRKRSSSNQHSYKYHHNHSRTLNQLVKRYKLRHLLPANDIPQKRW